MTHTRLIHQRLINLAQGRSLQRSAGILLLTALAGFAQAQEPSTPSTGAAGPLDGKQQDLFQQLDRDEDGRISVVEAHENAPLLSEFPELDYNNDGHLNAEEINDWEAMEKIEDAR